MIGSVYNESRGDYTYYRLIAKPGRPWVQPNSPVGTGAHDAAPALPLGSIPVGRGTQAQGVIVRPHLAGIAPTAGRVVVGALALYGLVRLIRG